MTKRIRKIEGPFNRVEGDLEVTLDIEAGRVAEARVNSPMFRGFEIILQGKDPRDALTFTPRICGICSISQSTAAARALADLQGLTPTVQGEIATQIIHGVENLVDHLTHFYLFFMPDFTRECYADRSWHADMLARFAVSGPAQAGWLKARAEILHVMGLLAGKWPHTLAIQPGGVTRAPDARSRVRLVALVRRLKRWCREYLFGDDPKAFAALASKHEMAEWGIGDVGHFLRLAEATGLWQIGAGGSVFLSFGAHEIEGQFAFAQGVFDGSRNALDATSILEDATSSWDAGSELHPFVGETRPDPEKPGAYSWCKAPRLDGRPAEVGALARQVVDGHPLALSVTAEGGSAAARIVGRLLEVARLIDLLEDWTERLEPGAAFMAPSVPMPRQGRGAGLVEAARGALGHWLVVEEAKIARYQIIAPTTWNFSPRDKAGIAGPLEQALAGVPEGVSVQHVVRSFDPCMVCTVH